MGRCTGHLETGWEGFLPARVRLSSPLGDSPGGDTHLRGTPGERGLPSIMAPLWGPGGPPGGAGGLKVAEPLLAVTPQGLSCWQAVLAVHPGASARSWQVKPGGVLGGRGVTRSHNMHSIGARAGGAAGTTLEAYRWGLASLWPPNLEENSAGAPAPGGPNDCKGPTDQQEWARQCAVGTALSGRLSWTHAHMCWEVPGALRPTCAYGRLSVWPFSSQTWPGGAVPHRWTRCWAVCLETAVSRGPSWGPHAGLGPH